MTGLDIKTSDFLSYNLLHKESDTYTEFFRTSYEPCYVRLIEKLSLKGRLIFFIEKCINYFSM